MNSEILETKATDLLKQRVEEKLAWKPAAVWKQTDYVLLSEKLFEETKVQLSPLTLKRVWGKVKYKGKPSPSTLNALANFVGHSSLEVFIQVELPEELQELRTNAYKKPNINKNKKKYLLALPLVVLIGLLIGWFVLSDKKQLHQSTFTDKVSLKVINPKSRPPHHFWVKYDLGGIETEGFILKVDYLTDLPIINQRDSLAFLYLLPGYGYARLLKGNKLIKKVPIFSITNGWEAYHKDELQKNNFVRLPIDTSHGKMAIYPSFLYQSQLDTTQDHWVNLYNIKEFDVSADDLSLAAELRNPFRPTRISKGSLHLGLWGENGVVDIHFTDLGNRHLVHHTISEVKVDKTNANLKAFSIDTKNWHKVKLQTKKKELIVTLNDNEIAVFAYNKPLGELKGVWFSFKGLGGEIKNIRLLDGEGGAVPF